MKTLQKRSLAPALSLSIALLTLLAAPGQALASALRTTSVAAVNPGPVSSQDLGPRLRLRPPPRVTTSSQSRPRMATSGAAGALALTSSVGCEANPGWTQVLSPSVSVGNNELNGTSAVALNDIWAVGDYEDGNTVAHTLAERWDGSAWTVIPTPGRGAGDNRLIQVAALASNNVWAVGFSTISNPDNLRQTLIEHWNGSSWSIVASPNAGYGANELFGIKARASNDIWAVGRVNLTGNAAGPIALHWNGGSWSSYATATPSEFNELADVVVFASNDAWAVGDQRNVTAGGPYKTLVEHWNGSGWFAPAALQASDAPDGSAFSSIDGTQTDFWAVGYEVVPVPAAGNQLTTETLAEHWTSAFSNWSIGQTPNGTGASDLIGVRYTNATDVHAFGVSVTGSSGGSATSANTLIEAYNGQWGIDGSPNPNLLQILVDGAVISDNDSWAVGFTQPEGAAAQTFTLHWCSPPYVGSVTPNSGPVAGGTTVVIGGGFLVSATSVMFGGVPAASYHVDSPSQITAVSPSQTGQTVDILVTTPYGTSSVNTSDQFTYIAPQPVVSSVMPTTGPSRGGTPVTITGTGLLHATAVKFGSVPATIISDSDTQITTTAPAQAQAVVDVTVTTAGGTSATSSGDQYSYVAPVPVVSAINPMSGSPLGGTSVSISGSGLSFAMAVKFGSSTAASYVVDSDAKITAVSPAGTLGSSVDVTVTTAGGTSGASASDVFTYAPTVTYIAPTSGPPAGATVITINGEGFTGASAVKFGSLNATSFTVVSDKKITATSPAASKGTVDVAVIVGSTTSAASISSRFTYGSGYWLVASDGGVFRFGDAEFSGSTGSMHLNQPIVGLARTPDDGGYWLVAADGGVFTFGDAGFYGSTGSIRLSKPVVGMVSTPTGKGYWLVAADGGVFTFGDAGFSGSAGGIQLNQPVVGIAATPDGLGYWLVAADGGIFTFGDAAFVGSEGGRPLNRPVVGMAATPDGQGYWLVASDGGIFTHGDAGFYGSEGGRSLNLPVVGMAATPDGQGYWLVARDGGVFTHGDALFWGSTGSIHLNQPVVGLAAF